MHTLDCSALKIHNHVIKEWKGRHKMGHSCVKVVELLVIFFPFIFLYNVMFLYVLYKYKINK